MRGEKQREDEVRFDSDKMQEVLWRETIRIVSDVGIPSFKKNQHGMRGNQ
jgi:hypothetical protein